MKKIPLIVIVGPTATGKTALSIELAKLMNGEVVSADSMQVYRHMDIGTAKPTKAEMQGIPHYLIDEIEPWEDFNVVKYVELAHKYINEIHKRGKLPILVGGTGLYVDSVVNNTKYAVTSQEQGYRDELLSLANEKGNEYIYNMLCRVDEKTASKLHPNDLKRVIRALEVYKFTGIKMSDAAAESHSEETPYKAVFFGLNMNREVLYTRINMRVDKMIQNGLLDEILRLTENGFSKNSTAFNAIGYKEMIEYLNGNYTFDQAVEAIKQGSRRYAKRQITWFKRNKNINWITVTPDSDIKNIALNCKTVAEGIIN